MAFNQGRGEGRKRRGSPQKIHRKPGEGGRGAVHQRVRDGELGGKCKDAEKTTSEKVRS